MYKLLPNDSITNKPFESVLRLSDDAFIPFDPANTDYQTFKKEINEGTAQLEDADGVLMTPQQAKDFVKELP